MPNIISLPKGSTFVGTDGTSYKKLNDRQLRDTCRKCGGTGGYWAESLVTNRNVHVTVDGAVCTITGLNGGNKPPTPTSVFGAGKPAEDIPSVTVEGGSSQLPPVQLPPVTVPTTSGSDDERTRALMELLMRPSVTPEQVATMVKSSVEERESILLDMVQEALNEWRANQHVPTSVEIKYADGAKVKIDNVHPKFDKILNLVLRGSNVLMVGPMGSGKSTIARNLATALDRKSLIFTCSIGTTKSDILGYMAADGYHASSFATAWERGYVICMDELDTLHPQVSPIVNDAFAAKELQFPNGQLDDDGDLIPTPLGEGGIIIAAANTVGRGADKMYVGRSKIDAATLDRFAMVEIDYDQSLEDLLVARTGASAKVQLNALKACRDLRKAAAANNIAANYGVRAMVDICRMVQSGFSHDEIVWGRLNRGMSDSDWKTLDRAVSIPVFI